MAQDGGAFFACYAAKGVVDAQVRTVGPFEPDEVSFLFYGGFQVEMIQPGLFISFEVLEEAGEVEAGDFCCRRSGPDVVQHGEGILVQAGRNVGAKDQTGRRSRCPTQKVVIRQGWISEDDGCSAGRDGIRNGGGNFVSVGEPFGGNRVLHGDDPLLTEPRKDKMGCSLIHNPIPPSDRLGAMVLWP